jgi:hypothetical protein
MVLGGALLGWFLVSELATNGWYAWKESQLALTRPWPIAWPTKDDAARREFFGFQPREMGESEKELLRFSRGRAASWRAPSGVAWTGFFIEWPPDRRLNQMDLAHNPTVCLTGAGLTLVRALPDVKTKLEGQDVRFHAWEFAMQGRPVFVYVGTRWARDFAPFSYREGLVQMRAGNIWRALVGNRENPLQTLELVAAGPSTPEAAEAAFREQLKQLANSKS